MKKSVRRKILQLAEADWTVLKNQSAQHSSQAAIAHTGTASSLHATAKSIIKKEKHTKLIFYANKIEHRGLQPKIPF